MRTGQKGPILRIAKVCLCALACLAAVAVGFVSYPKASEEGVASSVRPQEVPLEEADVPEGESAEGWQEDTGQTSPQLDDRHAGHESSGRRQKGSESIVAQDENGAGAADASTDDWDITILDAEASRGSPEIDTEFNYFYTNENGDFVSAHELSTDAQDARLGRLRFSVPPNATVVFGADRSNAVKARERGYSGFDVIQYAYIEYVDGNRIVHLCLLEDVALRQLNVGYDCSSASTREFVKFLVDLGSIYEASVGCVGEFAHPKQPSSPSSPLSSSP